MVTNEIPFTDMTDETVSASEYNELLAKYKAITDQIKNREGNVRGILRRRGHSSGYDRDLVAAFFKAFDEVSK